MKACEMPVLDGWAANYERTIDIYAWYVLAQRDGCKHGLARKLRRSMNVLQISFQKEFDLTPHNIDADINRRSIRVSGIRVSTPQHLDEQPATEDPTDTIVALHEGSREIDLLYMGMRQTWFEFGGESTDEETTLVDDVFLFGVDLEDMASGSHPTGVTYVPLGEIAVLGRGLIPGTP